MLISRVVATGFEYLATHLHDSRLPGSSRHDPAPTYSSSSNGRSERSGGIIMTMSRVMRLYSRLPANMWSEIDAAAVYILNRTPRACLG